jgi:HK97 family phage prohead protease
MTYNAPHLPAGSPDGGQFAPGGNKGSKGSGKGHGGAKGGAKTAPKDSLTTGVGMSGKPDAQVKTLQTVLNRLGVTDAAGKKLAVDGRFGPKTTSAVKAVQKRLGLKQDGVVTPALLSALTKAKSLPRSVPMTVVSERAPMSAASIDDLPDSAFAYIEPGGQKDASGKTTPRSKRHFPIHDEAHVRNALARAPQSPFGDKAMPKIMAAAKKYGIQTQMNSQQHAPDIDVIRALRAGPELRAAASGDSLGTLEIPFSPFDTWYEVNSKWEGRFMERTTPGTFADTIVNDRGIMRSLFDHGHDPQIGNKVLGPIVDLREDDHSPVGVVDLLDTAYNRDLLPGLRANVYGSSFRMHVLADTWDNKPTRSEHNPDGIPERTITKVRALEFGPVTFPANPAATATVRSATDYYYDQLRQRDTSAYEVAARAAGRFPDLTVATGTRSAGGGEPDAHARHGSASHTPDELRTVERALKALGVI